jgi:hypothetical protein
MNLPSVTAQMLRCFLPLGTALMLASCSAGAGTLPKLVLPTNTPSATELDMVQPGENLLDRLLTGHTLAGLMLQLPDNYTIQSGHPKVLSVIVPANRGSELKVWRINHNASGWFSEGNAALEWGWSAESILGLHLERNLRVHPDGVDTMAVIIALPSDWLTNSFPVAIVPVTPTIGKGTKEYRSVTFSHLSRLKSYPGAGQAIPENVVRELEGARKEGGIFLPLMPPDKLSIRSFVQYPLTTVGTDLNQGVQH